MANEKRYFGTTVYEEAKARIRIAFENFDKVCVSFSGGKDSTVLTHLTLEVAREMGRLPVDVLVIDLEGQYTATMDHVAEIMASPEVTPHWVCLPLNLRNASSATAPYWTCWDPDAKDRWVRPIPEAAGVISDPAFFPWFKPGMEFEQFIPKFNEWIAGEGTAACLVGIRSDESLNRWRAVKKQDKVKKCAWRGIQWTAMNHSKSRAVSMFPIYDWRFEDLWKYIGSRGLSYNRLYDLMYLTGMPFSEMRICQPYGDDQRKGLDLFHKLEPETWSKIVGRVEGANFAAYYAGQKFLGYKGGVGLPPAFSSWQQYVDFLMHTLPPGLQAVYRRRIAVFQEWWSRNGFELPAWPDAGDPALENRKMVPSWRRVAISMLKQDLGKSLSFGFAQEDIDRVRALKEKVAAL